MERQIQEYIEADRYDNRGVSIWEYSKHMYGLFQWYSEYICFIISQLSMLSPSRSPDASCIRDAVKGIPCTHARVEGAIKIQWWKVAAVGCNFRNCDCPWLFFVLFFWVSNIKRDCTEYVVCSCEGTTVYTPVIVLFLFSSSASSFSSASPLCYDQATNGNVNILY